jgi:tryptophan-rich sensory protein
VQLALNAAWTPIFFGLREMGWAFADIVLLSAAIVATIVAFWRHRRGAALLLVPYLLWVSFAALLNLRLWQLEG